MNEECWKEIALEYKKEVEQIYEDIESAIEEFEKKMPRSFEKGIGILEHSLSSSQEVVRLLKIRECSIKVLKVPEIKKPKVIDCFEGLL